jgi:CheY-like chemotaxis protein
MAPLVETLSVLLVEDDEDDYLITTDMLARQPMDARGGSRQRPQFTVDWCRDYDSALEAIRGERHDLYLIDYRLGRHTGLELVREGFSSRPWRRS